jgi:folylpolyglutamate synthase/dihydropteroate synthase
MPHTYEELKAKTVAELREIAMDTVQGASQMNKDHLLPALCKALGIDTHEHHGVHGIDKATVKARLQELKAARDKALDAHDHHQLKSLRRQMHRLNHQIRAHMD